MIEVISTSVGKIKEAHTRALVEDKNKEEHMSKMLVFDEDNHELKILTSRIWMLKMGSIWDLLKEESYKTMYSIHLGNTKMY